MPQIERSYNVSRKREERGIAGLSMGGAEAILTGLNHLDKFAWIGSFSGAFVMWRSLAEPGGRAGGGATQALGPAAFEKIFPGLSDKTNASIRMLWITCGTADSLIGVNREFKTWLRSKQIRFTEEEAADVGHVWPYWRRMLTEFAQTVFQR